MEKLLNIYKNKKKERKGFTLVELLVVIAILAVLASVSVVGYLGFTEKARVSDDNTELHQIGTLVQAELIDGSEDVVIDKDDNHSTHTQADSNSCNANVVYFTFADNVVGAKTGKFYIGTARTTYSTTTSKNSELLKAVKAMIEGENSDMVEYIKGASITTGQLKITYQHHASKVSEWTLGELTSGATSSTTDSTTSGSGETGTGGD